MELEFDKEIDAILRKAGGDGRAGAAGDGPMHHLDADIIAAFAENAVPERTRTVYTRHLADCDRCRKLLSQTVSMNPAVEASVATVIAAPAVQSPAAWYEGLFRLPKLAVAMGGLVLVFSGVLGYLIIQNERGEQDSLVTQVTEQERTAGAPAAVSNVQLTANSNAMATNTAPSARNAAVPNSAAANTAMPYGSAGTGAPTSSELQKAAPAEAEDLALSSRQLTDLPKPVAAPPPPAELRQGAVTRDGAEMVTDADKAEAEQREKMSLKSKRAESEAMRRDAPPPAAKAGPSRGPVQMQSNQVNNSVGDMTVTRGAGGRKFNNRDGAWYDTSYSGQPTINVRRGSEEFRKLDAGLRKIADELSGVVVVVWKGKAYRIQ